MKHFQTLQKTANQLRRLKLFNQVSERTVHNMKGTLIIILCNPVHDT